MGIRRAEKTDGSQCFGVLKTCLGSCLKDNLTILFVEILTELVTNETGKLYSQWEVLIFRGVHTRGLVSLFTLQSSLLLLNEKAKNPNKKS